ncbi:DUF732 domain-containing protein [Gordonia sp. (in: high G+C Gram-positive bacteria)]|uniref:DUF732 domain-containing protein n=1 Tax=Gordonia sp. (in: high G+C Gram-positive bacteria) TaxID=84139 RepID=UPI003C729465
MNAEDQRASTKNRSSQPSACTASQQSPVARGVLRPGYQICHYLRNGHTTTETVLQIVSKTSTWTLEAAGAVVGAATGTLCEDQWIE